jgi:anthranilate/para-aminobenzoate synthase component I
MQVGGGIVADSIPEEEYEESLLKGRLLFEAVEGGL